MAAIFTEKRCTRCGQLKLRSEFSYAAAARDGRTSACRSCCAGLALEYYRRKRVLARRVCRLCGQEKLVADFVTYQPDCKACRSVKKRCIACRLVKPLEEFSPNGRGFDKRYGRCKPCAAAVMRTPKMQERARNWKQRPEAKEQRNAQLRRRRRTDEKFAEGQRERARRRRQRIQTDGRTMEEFCAEEGWTCYLCLGSVELADAEVDHIIATANGGSDTRENLALTHRRCNRRKQAVPLERLAWVHPSALDRLPAVAGVQMLLNAVDARL